MTLSDGYEKINQFKLYIEQREEVSENLRQMIRKMGSLPKNPDSLDEWIGSFGSLKEKGFGLDTVEKQAEIRKEYFKFLEKSETNLAEIKILAIDDLLEKIKATLNTIN